MTLVGGSFSQTCIVYSVLQELYGRGLEHYLKYVMFLEEDPLDITQVCGTHDTDRC